LTETYLNSSATICPKRELLELTGLITGRVYDNLSSAHKKGLEAVRKKPKRRTLMAVKLLVRYGEIALKGRNRGQFEQQLHQNLKVGVKDLSFSLERLHGRLIASGPPENQERALEKMSRVFGVTSISPIAESELDLGKIKDLAAGMTEKLDPATKTFKVESRRPNKKFPYQSPELNSLIGGHLQALYPTLTVDLDQPDFTLYIEIGYAMAYLYIDKTPGPGGLPVGISGRSLLLLSGGIDSPLAGWLAMKRGLALEALHFHSYPFTSLQAKEKVIRLCQKLTLYYSKIPLHMISVTSLQRIIKTECPPELGVILLRRMMMRLAAIISEKRALQALITGENLGQVASQTLESIKVIAAATDMLILRPLVTMDKSEIIQMASLIDTYDTSIEPYEDCCTLFLPKSPVTKPKLHIVEKYEEHLPVAEMLAEAVATMETVIIRN
jgi:tRNA uracil 4-sulfurtransferase